MPVAGELLLVRGDRLSGRRTSRSRTPTPGANSHERLRSSGRWHFETQARAERFASATSAPITADQLIEPRRIADRDNSLWTTFQRVQENTLSGGQLGRSATGKRVYTRPVASIDRSVSLNRALWVLAEEMRRLKG